MLILHNIYSNSMIRACSIIFSEGLEQQNNLRPFCVIIETCKRQINEVSLQQTRQAIYLQRIFEARWWNHCCSGKEISITYSEWVFVALVIQHAKHMRHIVICVLSCSTIYIFLALSHKRHDFTKRNTEYNIRVSNFSATFVWKKISHSKKN